MCPHYNVYDTAAAAAWLKEIICFMCVHTTAVVAAALLPLPSFHTLPNIEINK